MYVQWAIDLFAAVWPHAYLPLAYQVPTLGRVGMDLV